MTRYTFAKNGAHQMRLAFQELGPSFIKLAQVISSSPGTFPPLLVEEFAHCQDDVPPEPWEQVAKTLEEELLDLRGHFRWIDWTPIAAASIAQVYPATLADGTEVVLKVQRTGLDQTLRQDLAIMLTGAHLLVRLVPSTSAVNPVGVIEDFADNLVQELDFAAEASHMERLRGILKGWPIRIPQVYNNLSTAKVLCMERLYGIKISDTTALLKAGIYLPNLVDTIVGSLIYSALNYGFFHGDGHPGNMLVLPSGELGLLDFGIVGQLNDEDRITVSELLAALIDRRFDQVALAVVKLSQATNVDIAAAVADLNQLTAKYLSGPIDQIPVARLLADAIRSANRQGVILPKDLVLLFKQILYLDGLGRRLNPNFDVFADGARFKQYLAPGTV
jgi:ubiquinone biosynthesis protein